MTNEKKLTKVDKFTIIANIEDVKNNAMLSEFVAKEIALLTKKNSERKQTATQKANEALSAKILDFMTEHEDQQFSVTDLLKQCEVCADLSNQKVTAIMNVLLENKAVERVVEKRKAYYRLAQ